MAAEESMQGYTTNSKKVTGVACREGRGSRCALGPRQETLGRLPEPSVAWSFARHRSQKLPKTHPSQALVAQRIPGVIARNCARKTKKRPLWEAAFCFVFC